MAKLRIEWENNIQTFTLLFRGKEFSYSMCPTPTGTESDKSILSWQLKEEFEDMEEILEEWEEDEGLDVDMLSYYYEDEDNVFEILDRLGELEE